MRGTQTPFHFVGKCGYIWQFPHGLVIARHGMNFQAAFGKITPAQSRVVKNSKTPISAPKQRNPSWVGLCYIRALGASIRLLDLGQHSSESMLPFKLHACRLYV